MHKKIHADLLTLAHSILQMKNRDDVVALKNKAEELYQKLSVLSFVEEYLLITPNAKEDIKEISKKLDKKFTSLKTNKKHSSKNKKADKNINPENFEDVFVKKEDTTQITLKENIKEVEESLKSKSLNDKLLRDHIEIGLNDRIAFVKHLFDGKQEDFNRVLSQINSFETEKEVMDFFDKIVKPDYNWENKEEYIERFIDIVTKKFI